MKILLVKKDAAAPTRKMKEQKQNDQYDNVEREKPNVNKTFKEYVIKTGKQKPKKRRKKKK